jgi:hypothetical protein
MDLITLESGRKQLLDINKSLGVLIPIHPAYGWRVVENWCAPFAAGNNGWQSILNSGLIGLTSSIGNTKISGIARLETSVSASAAPTLSLGAASVVLGLRRTIYETRINFSSPTAIEDFIVRVGLHNSTSGTTPTNGIFLDYNRSLSPNWICRVIQGGVETSVTSGVAVPANNWQWVKIEVSANNGDVKFYSALDPVSDGVLPTYTLLATITTNIPNGVSQVIGPAYQIIKTAGTSSRLLYAESMVLESLSF